MSSASGAKKAVDDDDQAVGRQLKLIVYSALVAFVVLAVYGFWLITSLTRDVNRLSVEVSAMTRVIDRDMSRIADSMGQMESRMVDMAVAVQTMDSSTARMANTFDDLSGSVGSMNRNIASMSRDTASMAGSTLNMQRDMWSLNRNVSGPLGFMNAFNPFANNPGPFPGSPAPFVDRRFGPGGQ